MRNHIVKPASPSMGARAWWACIVALIMLPVVTVRAADWHPATNPIMTPWADKVDPAHPLPDYPRPQMVRKDWTNLNSLWDYAITPKELERPVKWDGQILVPFCVESALSGVMKPLTPNDRLWYRRTFAAPDLTGGKRLLLHFGAVDWEAIAFVNGKWVGSHRGGYDAFTFDVTDALKTDGGDNELLVSVWDPTGTNGSARGKQNLASMAKPGGIFYTPCSGIWQTVWIEPVPARHIVSLKIMPDVDREEVRVKVQFAGDSNVIGQAFSAKVLDDGKEVGTSGGESLGPIAVSKPKLWTPEDPHLYELKVITAPGDDVVTSYFAFRKIELAKDDKGILRPTLNGKPVFMSGPLDQGFWPDGIYTAPTDDALRYDIEITKKLGFNATRKHVKVEPDRWYYWCDKLGLLVWQDMPGGGVSKNVRRDSGADGVATNAEAAKQFEAELKAMIEQHANHPSIVMWVVFNEGWGQYDTPRLTKWVKELDPTRLVNDASGWEDQKVGDVHDMHHYPAPAAYDPEPNRVSVLGEFGGLGLPVEGHKWVETGGNWGYQNMTGDKALTRKYVDLWREVWKLRESPGMSAAIYTQLTDVETESNGLLTYDRKVIKVDVDQTAAAVSKGVFPPLPTYETVVPTAEREAITWRYTTDKPADDWFQPNFDASQWKEGPAGFGHAAKPEGTVRTEWKSPDIWIRREFDLPAGDAKNIAKDLALRCYHDENIEVYLNGVPATRVRGYNDAYELFDLAPVAISALKPGKKNTIAIHCHQTTGGQFIDAGLVREVAPGR